METELGGYQIVGRIAVGGMAEVYQAKAGPTVQRSPDEPSEVVLKRLLPAYRADGGYVKQFVDEAKLTVQLVHPNVVRTFRCFRAGQDYLTVQELVPGRTLAYVQELFMKANKAMPPSAATYVVYCVVKALEYVHKKRLGGVPGRVVHRDVNPANVMLSVSGDVKLIDFGIADIEGVTGGEKGALRGTLAYMSPEQVLGLSVDQRSDLYSVGILLWELFANSRLHPGDSEMEVMHRVRDGKVPVLTQSELPFNARQIVRRALFADKELRFQTAMEFGRALEVLAYRNGWPLSVDALKPLLTS